MNFDLYSSKKEWKSWCQVFHKTPGNIALILLFLFSNKKWKRTEFLLIVYKFWIFPMWEWREKRVVFLQNGHPRTLIFWGQNHSVIVLLINKLMDGSLKGIDKCSSFHWCSLKVSYNNFPSSSVSSLAKCATNNLVCFHVHKTNIGTTGTKAVSPSHFFFLTILLQNVFITTSLCLLTDHWFLAQ
jgi:hypothetical protein